MVGLESVTILPVKVISRRSTPEIVFSRIFFSNLCKQGGKLDYSRYSQVSLLTLCYHLKTLSNSFYIRNGNCQRLLSLSAILYKLPFNSTVAYHSN